MKTNWFKKSFLFVLFSLLLLSCNSRSKEKDYNPSEFGMLYDDMDYLMKYVYIDRTKCLHVSKECLILDSVYQVEFIDTIDLKRTLFDDYCSKCINIHRYEHIDDILSRNGSMADRKQIPGW